MITPPPKADFVQTKGGANGMVALERSGRDCPIHPPLGACTLPVLGKIGTETSWRVGGWALS